MKTNILRITTKHSPPVENVDRMISYIYSILIPCVYSNPIKLQERLEKCRALADFAELVNCSLSPLSNRKSDSGGGITHYMQVQIIVLQIGQPGPCHQLSNMSLPSLKSAFVGDAFQTS